MLREVSARKGFTLVELIIVVSILATVFGTVLPFFGSFQETTLLTTEMQNLVQHARRAQSNAVSGKRNSDWGVQFTSTGTIVFAGSTFASRNTDLDQSHTFDLNVATSGSGEVVFVRQSGHARDASSTTLYHIASGTGTIVINDVGQIHTVLELITTQ